MLRQFVVSHGTTSIVNQLVRLIADLPINGLFTARALDSPDLITIRIILERFPFARIRPFVTK